MKEFKRKGFSLQARKQSILHALRGIRAFFNREPNAVIHLCVTIMVICLAFIFRVSPAEVLALVLATGFVWVAELFNTAIEKIMDFVSEEKHPAIKFIKDVSAAAVLVAAFTALCVGALVFIPKIFLLW